MSREALAVPERGTLVRRRGRGPLAGLRRLRVVSMTARSSLYDCVRFLRHSSAQRALVDFRQFGALMDIDTHRLEKGLSLPMPRFGFGREVVERLWAMVQAYPAEWPTEYEGRAVSALRAYRRFHREHDAEEPWMASIFEAMGSASTDEVCGTKAVSRIDVLDSIPPRLADFFASRSSVRQFGEGEVTDGEILAAVQHASHTPSVCNRQPWRVHSYAGPDEIRRILERQNGNRGFGEQIARLLVVTVDLRAFTKPGERFQAWIDGGMYAMSLVYALHGLGLATCTLNCSTVAQQDRRLRAAASIPENEAVIMMIGVGRLADRYLVAMSPRRAPGAYIVEHTAAL